jgi:hypothetical protein
VQVYAFEDFQSVVSGLVGFANVFQLYHRQSGCSSTPDSVFQVTDKVSSPCQTGTYFGQKPANTRCRSAGFWCIRNNKWSPTGADGQHGER